MIRLEFEPIFHTLQPKGQYWSDLRLLRQGVCLHYDASGSDAGGLAWLQGLDVKASYNIVVLDDGAWGFIAPLNKAAWHAGKSRASESFSYPNDMANHALYGVSILSSGKDDVTPRQMLTAAWLCARLFRAHLWPTSELWRVTTHRAEAWARGRKTDPEGSDLRNPILSADDVRTLIPLFRGVEPLSA